MELTRLVQIRVPICLQKIDNLPACALQSNSFTLHRDLILILNMADCWVLQFAAKFHNLSRKNTKKTLFFTFHVLHSLMKRKGIMPGEQRIQNRFLKIKTLTREQTRMFFINAVQIITLVLYYFIASHSSKNGISLIPLCSHSAV